MMDFYLGLAQIVGVHTILGLSAYVILQTGQLSMAQAGFAAIGGYVAAMLTVLASWHVVPAILAGAAVSAGCACLVGFPALRIRGLMLVVATIAFGEAVRLFFFNFNYQIVRGNLKIGPVGAEGFRQIRFFPENSWTTFDVAIFIWAVAAAIMAAIIWLDHSRFGKVLRAVGDDEIAAQCVGVNLTFVKVTAVTLGGALAGIAGGLYAHYTTHIEHSSFTLVLATFAVVYPVLGGLYSVFGVLLAVVFVQVFLIEVLRFLGDWRSLLFGLMIILAMNLRPQGLLDRATVVRLRALFRRTDA
jgi:branched-chain amino acid transport system permease protein